MVDFVQMEVIVALMVVKIVVMIMVMMVDTMGDMMAIMEMGGLGTQHFLLGRC